ncbi:MAG: Glutamine--scyllo-inositol transaminase [Gammaproteobacteria bacterium]|jgi:dTDP-4-amino-4,6-dideoxygalactose transaminase|nr:Glutamine--scyllo-inositol transaminase [Gammaproteobacteria bacterium]
MNADRWKWPYYAPDEIEAVTKVLASGKVNYWTGEEARLFEKEYAAHVGTKYAIAMMNGTVTMEAALHALGIGAGDEVIVPSHTFIATASAVVMRGAKPVVADISQASNNITLEAIKAAYTEKTKAIIVVHLAGWPCDMDPILAFAKQHKLKIIEDCAQANGATYKGKPVGSFGDISSFSFCQDKIITTGGEGGMVVTNDESLWRKMWAFKDHGKSYAAVYEKEHQPGFRWLHEAFGTNFRMTEVQAAIGRAQLKKLTEWKAIRRRNAGILTDCFRKISALRVEVPPADIEHAYYKYYVYLRPELLKPEWPRDRIIGEINKQGIPCFWGGCSEIYREKAFTDAGYAPAERFPNAKHQGETALVFLVHPTLTEQEIEHTCLTVKAIMQEASQ